MPDRVNVLVHVCNDQRVAPPVNFDRAAPRQTTADNWKNTLIAALPGPARQALLIAALADSAERGTVVSALQILGHDETSLDAALNSGLIRADNGRCIFRHPLARVTAAYAALRADRTAAHAAIAEVSTGEARTWHRARAAQRPDESIAADLELVAGKARNGGAFAAAARAFEFAARLTPEPEMRAGRLLEAGRAARSAGNVHAALDHVDAALRAGPRDPTRREAEHLRGLIIARSGSAEIARDQLIALGARLERDSPEIAGETFADAVLPALRAGGPAEAVRIGRRSTRLTSGAGGDAAVSSQIALGIALIYAGDYLAGASLVENASELADVADPQQRVYLGLGLLLADRYEPARRVLTQLADEARADGAVSALPYTLIRLADVEIETGAWSAAAAALHEARRLASETGQAADHGLALGSLAWLEAATGNYEDCRTHLDDARALAERLGGGSRFHRAAVALGLLELGRGDVDAAVGQLEEICRQQDADGWSDAAATPHCRPDLVEAYAIAGREQEARAELELFRLDAERTQRPSGLAAVLRCEALLAEEPDLDRLFSAALGHAGMGPFDRARTELRYGERLLAAGREDEAKVPLGNAVGGFERLGAEPWAARARAAAVAAGGAPPPAQLPIIDRLSPLELEVAVAAAEGAASADIAERLILGVRTVELQLASAMIKLGLKSPAELAELVRSDTAQAQAVPQPI